jgi:hypothetical protein
VLEIGDRVQPARVLSAPHDWVDLGDLTANGPILFLFYLFDWSST